MPLNAKTRLLNKYKLLSTLKIINNHIKNLHVANTINFLLTHIVNIPNPTQSTGNIINNGKLSGSEYIKYKQTLFNVKLIINPIHIPIQNKPALGKYANT